MASLWIETAHQSLITMGADAVSTFQTEKVFFAVVASGACNVEGGAAWVAQTITTALEQGTQPDAAMDHLLACLPASEYASISVLEVIGNKAHLVECDAPPLFFTHHGQLVLLPVVEEEAHGRLIRQCEFTLQDGDHLAMVSESYIHAKGWNRQWSWRDIALSIKRLTDTRCDAEQLLGALIRSYQRLAEGELAREVSVMAMFARPMRTATVWSGPPARRGVEKTVLDKLMAEPGWRIICGDTTAQIAARLLGAELDMEPPPDDDDGWTEVPPTSRLAGVDLVTEGVVTMGKARERLAQAQRARELPRKEDGATRLARLLLNADKINFLVGLTVNPAQAADPAKTMSMRQLVVEGLTDDLKAHRKIVSVEYF